MTEPLLYIATVQRNATKCVCRVALDVRWRFSLERFEHKKQQESWSVTELSAAILVASGSRGHRQTVRVQQVFWVAFPIPSLMGMRIYYSSVFVMLMCFLNFTLLTMVFDFPTIVQTFSPTCVLRHLTLATVEHHLRTSGGVSSMADQVCTYTGMIDS